VGVEAVRDRKKGWLLNVRYKPAYKADEGDGAIEAAVKRQLAS
jgi:hypothetical protein